MRMERRRDILADMIFTIDELKYLQDIQDAPRASLATKAERAALMQQYWIPVHRHGMPYLCVLCKTVIWAHVKGETTYYKHGAHSEQVYKMTHEGDAIPGDEFNRFMAWLNGLHAKEVADGFVRIHPS